MTRLPSLFGGSASNLPSSGGGTNRRLTPQHFNPYLDPLTAAYLQQDQMARKENEERYLDIISGLQGTRGRITGDLDQFGQSLRDDTNRRADLSLDDQISDLTSRGLGASTIRSTIKRANDRDRNAELRRVEDLITDKQTSADERLSNALYAAMERRNDVQPDLNQLAKLSQGLGQAGMAGAAPMQGGYNPYINPDRRQLGTTIRRPTATGGISAGPGGPSYGSYTQPPVPRYASPPIYAAPTGGYTAPPQSGGLDDPLSNATARYADRQSINASPLAMGAGAYGGGYYPFYGTNTSGSSAPKWQYAPPKPITAVPTGTSDRRPNAYLNAQNALIDQRNSAKAEFMRPKTHVWTHDRTYYPGFGSTLKKELDGVGLAPGVMNLPYQNPAQQLNQLQAGAIGSAGGYPTMNDYANAYRQYGARQYPYGQPTGIPPRQGGGIF